MTPARLITRRRMLLGGLASLGGLFAAGCSKQSAPTYGNLLRLGDNFTYSAHRALLSGRRLVKEFSRSQISSFPATGCTNPATVKPDPVSGRKPNELYARLQAGAFTDWKLSVEGLVAKPGTYSLAD